MAELTSDGRTPRKMADWTSVHYVVVDVEGNGQQPPDLVELAVVPIVGGVINEPMSWLVRPDTPITARARSIHGITNAQVADLPVFADIEADVIQALNDSALIAHNAHVDIGVLRRKLGTWECSEVFDTLKLTRRLRPEQGSCRLGSLVADLSLAGGLSSDLKPHRATYDALVTARLFMHIAAGRSLEELRDTSSGGGDDGASSLF
ncbi:MAG: 3'-5' exonuclease [Actinomycetota bacterium]|nr:3'-5' exonuclease [Actinomycetota bacterium]